MLYEQGAQLFAEMTSALTIVDGVHDGQDLGSVVASSAEVLDAARSVERMDTVRWGQWHDTLQEQGEEAMGAMLVRDLDPKGFIERMQRGRTRFARTTSSRSTVADATAHPQSGLPPKGFAQMRKGRIPFILTFLAPPLVLYFVLVLSPFAQGIQISLRNWTGFTPTSTTSGWTTSSGCGATRRGGTRC